MLTPEARLPDVRTALRARLDTPADSWLTSALTEAAQAARTTPAASGPAPDRRLPPASPHPPPWEARFAAAGRHCTGSRPPHQPDPEAAEAARILLLYTACAGVPTVTRLYAHGTAAERRAVLVALPYLGLGPDARPLVEDALRTNDTRLIAAAVGPYAARHLDARAWRHAVLKCLFTGVPVAAVAELAERAHGDAELARMLRDYARERTAAFRPVPADLRRVLAHTEPPPSPDYAPTPDNATSLDNAPSSDHAPLPDHAPSAPSARPGRPTPPREEPPRCASSTRTST